MSKRKIVTNGMVALAIMLFVFMYMTGKKVEKEEKQANEDVLAEQHIEMESVSPLEDADKHEEGHPSHTHDVMSESELDQNVRPLEDAPEEERTYTISDYFTEDEIQAAKDIATQFSTSIYSFNGDEIKVHIEAVQSITAPELYETLIAQTGRATNSAYKAEITKFELLETYDQVSTHMVFSAFIDGKVFSSDGSLFEEQSYVYYVKVEKLVSEFKVSDVRIVKVDSR